MSALTKAMVLAAGRGVRMRPLTNDKPKALVSLCGETLLDRALNRCRDAGVTSIAVNAHYKGELIRSHLRESPDIQLSWEDELLETGGGVCKALPLLGSGPFFVINCDSIWFDGSQSALSRLGDAWCEDEMDALLLLQPVEKAVGYSGSGDFSKDDTGRIQRRGKQAAAPFVFMGVQVLHPRLFTDEKIEPFSLNRLYDRALAHNRLFGVVHDGDWYHVGTPEDLAIAETALNKPKSGSP